MTGLVFSTFPIISILQKLLATCFIKRISDKIDSIIPLSQAAYRKGRSTTEHVFAMKILCQKAITSCDYSTHILLLDMTNRRGSQFRTIFCTDRIWSRLNMVFKNETSI